MKSNHLKGGRGVGRGRGRRKSRRSGRRKEKEGGRRKKEGKMQMMHEDREGGEER